MTCKPVGAIHRMLINKTRKCIKIKFCKLMAAKRVLQQCGCESWTITERGETSIESAKMKFLRNVNDGTFT